MINKQVVLEEDTVKVTIQGETPRFGVVTGFIGDLVSVQCGNHEVLAFADEVERVEQGNQVLEFA
ncbi:hypothetical protein Lumi_087 [Xylophilus phage Lumi]|nr:hypothetical protein Lumi_087 [Xylophilus phage Lumi]